MKEIILCIISLLVGFFLGLIKERKNIKYKNYRGLCDKAINIFTEIKNEINYNHRDCVDIILKYLQKTDQIVDEILIKICRIKASSLKKAYSQYKRPKNNSVIIDICLSPYNWNEKKFLEYNNPPHGIKNGKELAIYNIKQITKILK